MRYTQSYATQRSKTPLVSRLSPVERARNATCEPPLTAVRSWNGVGLGGHFPEPLLSAARPSGALAQRFTSERTASLEERRSSQVRPQVHKVGPSAVIVTDRIFESVPVAEQGLT